ncbi:DUF5655 domain-containing protein [Mucilaginibacter sp. FT3.2]|uniref:DUF5655 domain-containing protein n=1 Tax=Mucilaginibacter sp. FT3.2 TaxID=2723090 RepID=UPI00160AC74B|nr:DUF5655 domain-containing protein [Mucilaginibacter sp. FT3.2]MBB6235301.1 putative transport protein [Mucilaginibacter sp. FT3.2]
MAETDNYGIQPYVMKLFDTINLEAVIKLYQTFKQAILKLNSGIDIIPKKTYIAFKKKTNIVDIEIQDKTIKLWINLKKGQLNDPLNLMRDVSILKGHNGNGDYELIVSDIENLDYIVGLIKQAIA